MANESFALPEQRPVFSQETAAPITPQAGMVGGNISGGLQLRDPSKDAPSVMDHLIAFGLKMGDQKMAEYEAEKKDRQFMAGIGRAAAGEAAKDIKAAQPWYAQLFGVDVNVVAGARAWEGATDANHMEASIMDRMKSLRELPPAQAQAALLDIHKTMQSGDPTRDATQSAMWIKALPGVLKQHAKEHVAYQQEVATEAQRKGIESGMDAFESRLQGGKGFMSDADADANLQSLEQTLTAPKGVNKVTHAAQVVEGFANTIAAGKFQPYTAAKAQGLLDNLPKAQRRQLDVLYDRTAQEQMAQKLPPGIMDRVGGLVAFDTPDKLRAEIKAINEEAKAATGIDYPLISTAEEQSYTTRNIHASIAEQEREVKHAKNEVARAAAAQRLKETKDAAKKQLDREQTAMAEKLATAMVTDPNPASIPLMRNLNLDVVPAQKLKAAIPIAVAQAWIDPPINTQERQALASLPPEQQASASRALEAQARWRVLSKDGADLSVVRSGIGEALKTGDYTQARNTIEALAMGATGPKKDKLPDRFTALIPEAQRAMVAAFANVYNNMPIDPKTLDRDGAAAWAAAELQMATSVKKPLKAADRKAIEAAIEAGARSTPKTGLVDRAVNSIATMFGGDDSEEPQPKMLLSLLAAQQFDSRVNSGTVTPASVAVASAKERAVILQGSGMGYIANPQAASNVTAKLPEAEKFLLNKDYALGNAMRDALAAKGGAPDTSVIYRADDSPKGEPSFLATAPSGGFIVLTLADLTAAAKKRNKLPTAPAAGVDYTPAPEPIP